MPDEPKTFDPFKPSQPRIPGVSDAPAAPPQPAQAAPSPAPVRRLPPQLPPKWIAIGAAGAVVLGMILAWLVLRPSAPTAPAAAASVSTQAAEPSASAIASSATVSPEVAPLYPDEVASIEEMGKPWAWKRFNFTKTVASGPVPAMLVRLPAGAPRNADSYWAFSLKSRYGKCEMELVTDLEKILKDYGYRAQHPMVVESCTSTVFDPLRRGTVSGAWVRGEVVQGGGMRPPLMIEVQIKGNRILAVQME